jgi:hypothetical protein
VTIVRHKLYTCTTAAIARKFVSEGSARRPTSTTATSRGTAWSLHHTPSLARVLNAMLDVPHEDQFVDHSTEPKIHIVRFISAVTSSVSSTSALTVTFG